MSAATPTQLCLTKGISFNKLYPFVDHLSLSPSQGSAVSLAGDFAELVPSTDFYRLAAKGQYLRLWSHRSFLLSKADKILFTDSISCCTGLAVSNGEHVLLCHFMPSNFKTRRDFIFNHLGKCLKAMKRTGSSTISAVVYSGRQEMGQEVFDFVTSQKISTLGLIGQKPDFEGGILYRPEDNRFLINVNKAHQGDPLIVGFYDPRSAVCNKKGLKAAFAKIKFKASC